MMGTVDSQYITMWKAAGISEQYRSIVLVTRHNRCHKVRTKFTLERMQSKLKSGSIFAVFSEGYLVWSKDESRYPSQQKDYFGFVARDIYGVQSALQANLSD